MTVTASFVAMKDKEMSRMKKAGWYTFEDGYTAWYSGLSKQELAVEIRKHGKLVKFEA